MPVVTLVAAFASAATFGLSTSLQHLVSSGTSVQRPDRLLVALLRTPLWVLGMSLSLAAFVLHAVALASGTLVLVQPIVVTGVVFAVLFRAGLDRRLPSGAEVRWSVLTWAGLAAFLLGAGSSAASLGVRAPAGTVVILLLALAAGAGLAARGRPAGSVGKGLWLGVASGVLFGLVAVLLTLALPDLHAGVSDLVTSWPAWLMVACGVVAVLVNQRAYQTTRLSVSMPILNIVDVLVAIGFAAIVLGEAPALDGPALLVEAAGLLGMAVGVARLAGLAESDVGPLSAVPPGGPVLCASPTHRGPEESPAWIRS